MARVPPVLHALPVPAAAGIPFQPWLRGRLDGISPSECRQLMSARDLVRPGVLKHVSLHSRFEGRHAEEKRDLSSELSKAGFRTELIRANVRKLLKVVRGLTWKPGGSAWSEYAQIHTYNDDDLARKAAFVAEAAGSRRWRLLWDLGCNDARFTRIAADHADYSVAIDADEAVVDGVYRSLHDEGNASILPLTLDLADPSPSLGWGGAERRQLAERGTPDLVLCLALLHHVSISSNVPVRSFVQWLRGLGASVVIEFVTRDDPMAKLLLQRKGEGANPDYGTELFEQALREAFEVERTVTLCEGTRRLYFAHPRRP
jgi:hypothetical protein